MLLAAELEFPKILVPRLSQHTSNVKIECDGMSESQNGQNNSILYMWPAFWSTDTSQIYYSGINLFLFMMPGVSYLIYGCSSARTTPVASRYRSLTLEENIVAVIT